MNRHRATTCFFLLILLLASVPALAQEITVAILPFEEVGYINVPWKFKEQMLDGLAQMLTDGLANEPDLIIVDRSRIEEIITEQDFQHSGRVDTTTAVQLGRLLGTDLLYLGSLNEFGWKNSGGISVGPFSISGAEAKVRLSARIIAVQTGQVLASLESEGTETGTALSISAFEGISFGTADFSDSVIGKALHKAVDALLVKSKTSLNSAKDRLLGPALPAKAGKVLAIAGDYYILDLGAADGVTNRTRFNVYKLQEVEGLAQPVRIPAGVLRVVSIDPNATVAEVEGDSTSSRIKVGDYVEIAPL